MSTAPLTAEPVRLLHIGDVHLGVELHGRPLPERGYGSRVQDFLNALDQALELGSAADLVLFAGDLYRNCEPSPTIQRELARRLRRAATRAPVVLIPGNHDLPNAWARAGSLDIFQVLEVPNVHVLRRPQVARVATARGTVLVASLPHLPRSALLAQEEARGKTQVETQELLLARLTGYLSVLAEEITAARAELGEQTPAVLLAHGSVAGAVLGGYGRGALLAAELELPLSAVRRPEFDYVALGHIHKHQSLPPNDHSGQPPVVYAGSIERVDFGEEGEEKVVVEVLLRRGATTWGARPLRTREFRTLKADFHTAAPGEGRERVLQRLEGLRESVRDAVVRLHYRLPPGDPPIPDREIRAALDGVAAISGIRMEQPDGERTGRVGVMSTQLTPLEALGEYLAVRPELLPLRDALLARARELLAELEREQPA